MTDRDLLFERCMQGDLVDSAFVLKVLNQQRTIRGLMKEAHQTAIEHGWWEKDRNNYELIALMHSELSEALEDLRKGDTEHVVEELADVLIRVFDMCGARGWDLESAVLKKMAFNKTRPYRHGGKLA